MAATSRSPLEFVAVVGVLVVTIAIVEVPRGPMLPETDLRPAAEDLDGATRPGPLAVAPPGAVPPTVPAVDPDAPWLDRRRAGRLRDALGRQRDRLARRRSRLAAAELLYLRERSRVAPLEAAYAEALELPRDSVADLLGRRGRLREGRAAVVDGHRALDALRREIADRARSVAAADLRVQDLAARLTRLAAGRPD